MWVIFTPPPVSLEGLNRVLLIAIVR